MLNKPLDYFPPIGEEKWRSTPPDYLRGLLPYWGSTKAMTFKRNEIELKPPLAFSIMADSEFAKQAIEVHNTAKNLTTNQRWIAEFWCDDFNRYTIDAAARWIAISDQFLKQEKADLETVLLINAKVGIALFDASILCWEAKYKFNVLRPVSYIQANIEKGWLPPFNDPTKGEYGIGVTPQHPSYPSGHSIFGQAFAEVLINVFGDIR